METTATTTMNTTTMAAVEQIAAHTTKLLKDV